jgi:ATP-dependent helicase Lhr and Lhr-like helicase
VQWHETERELNQGFPHDFGPLRRCADRRPGNTRHGPRRRAGRARMSGGLPEAFGAATRAWFEATFAGATDVQRRGWEAIARGGHALLVAPTGSGKTLAAFLWAIDRLTARAGPRDAGTSVVYVSPLKALVYDIERNLRTPLAGVGASAERLGLPRRALRVDVRTGDTPQRERARQARAPGDILVTTPESLYLLLGSGARERLANVGTVIVDEIHALAPVKRGTHLALSLERLCELTERDPQRIGLSATVRPLERVARFLGGANRRVEIVDASAPPRLELEVTVPVPDMEHVPAPAQPQPDHRPSRAQGAATSERGIWPLIYPDLVARIRAARSTIVFVNSRGLCERLAERINALAGEPLVRAHHGSVAHEQRAAIEEGLKAGTLRALVATSSLELGIDMGAVDQVLLVESPGTVARGLQRVGRAGHGVGETSRARIYPKYRGDLLECAVVAERMLSARIEETDVPRNALDVLAQQIVAMCSDAPRTVDEIRRVVRRAHAYADLADDALDGVLEMLSGGFPSTDLADLRPRLAWDRTEQRLSARRGTALLARVNGGTIPDRGYYAVYAGEGGPRIGELDEEMVFETRPGDTVVLGSSTWRVESIGRDRVLVSPAPGEPGRLPFWRGEGPGRPLELGHAIGAFVREVGARDAAEALRYVRARTPLDAYAADNLVAYVHEQLAHTGTLPTERAVTVERFRDELGDWRVCILTPLGARVHAPWALAVQHVLSRRAGYEAQVSYTDDGIMLRFADADEPPSAELLLPGPEEAVELVTAEVGNSALYAGRFRENAARALLLARPSPQRSPLWAQRVKARDLLAAVRRHPGFPIVLETYREILGEVFDLPSLERLLAGIRSREVEVHEVVTRGASPFARSLVFAQVAAQVYEQDAPLAERRAGALTLDRALLRELLGETSERELVDADVVAAVSAELQRTADDRRARDADETHDLLRRLGDLTDDELRARSEGEPAPRLEALVAQGRALRALVAGQARWIAAEDAGLYRDALGVDVPQALPERFLAPVADPLVALVRRYARVRGPFAAADPAVRYGLRAAPVASALAALEAEGALVRVPVEGADWCDADIWRQVKRRTLAKLRHEIAPVDAATYARFLGAWHGLGAARAGPRRLEEVVAQLEGLPLPWSSLSRVLLPARVADFKPSMLDMLCASGAIVWVGCGAMGARDGRIAIYRRTHAASLLPGAAEPPPDGPVHAALLDQLERRGASFLTELYEAAAPARADAVQPALWDLVWAGLVTNDTFAPLHALARRSGRRGREDLAGGRWSLVRALRDPGRAETERAYARASLLLERYGVLSREAAATEDVEGGFAALYKMLRAMEDAGRVRRGHFVEGLAGAQFAQPGVVDRLRGARAGAMPGERGGDTPEGAGETTLALAAIDPANPYGALLPWPEVGARGDSRPRRVPGAWVVLVEGVPALYASAGGRQLLTFAGANAALASAFAALHRLPRSGRRRLTIETIDDVPVRDSPHAPALAAAGFVADYRGVTAWR